MSEELLNTTQAIEYLKIEKKEFENYFKSSKEIKYNKIGNRLWFKREDLDM